MKTIKSKKIILRRFRKSDAKNIAHALNNWNVVKNLSNLPFPYTLDDANFWLSKIADYGKGKAPTNIVFCIEKDGKAAGAIGLHEIEKNHKAEMGYWLSEEYWGQGIMSEAVGLVVKLGFAELKLRRVYSRVYLFNPASARVLEKRGFAFEGIEKKGAKKGEKYIDCKVYSKVK